MTGMSEPLALMLGERDIKALIPYPARDANKYSRGTVGIVGGSASYPGAPILAARAAACCGAGYVRLVTTRDAATCAHAHLISIPVSSCDQGLEGTLCATSLVQVREDLAKSQVILIGPGMGATDDTERFMANFPQDRPMVFDADALNLIARNHALLEMPACYPRILTPHEGEAARLLGREIANRNEDALQLACEYEAIVVLKGPETLIATPAGNLRAIVEGGPELAKAGTGDVLGGMIAAFLAQGLDAFDAATLAVFVHGRAGRVAARELSVQAVMPEDIICKIGPVLLGLEAEDIS